MIWSSVLIRPPIIFIRVVFPHPDGPTIQTNSLDLMLMSISLRTFIRLLLCLLRKDFSSILIAKFILLPN